MTTTTMANELVVSDSLSRSTWMCIGFATLLWWGSIAYMNSETRKLRHIPTVGTTWPIISFIGTIKYMFDAKSIVDEGLRRWPGKLFKYSETVQWRVVVTDPRMAEEVIRAPDSVMSSQIANDELVQIKFTLGQAITSHPYHMPLLSNELRKALEVITPDIYNEIHAAFEDLIPASKEWTAVNMNDQVMNIVCRASNRIFVGAPLCRDKEWVDLNVKFTIHVLTTGLILRAFPTFLRPFITYCISSIPKDMAVALRHLRPIFAARRKEVEEKGEHADSLNMVAWLMNLAKDEELEDDKLTMRILAINFGAIHTSSLSFMHTFYYLAANPKFADVLREEVDEILSREGWTKQAVDSMVRVDSFIRESQRLSPLSNVSTQRVLLRDFTFYDGTTLPAGTCIALCTHSAHFSVTNYTDPLTFDPLRFVKMKAENPGKQYGIISTSGEFLPFGVGRHACPGRYFAASELKLMLAYIVTHYDVRLEEGNGLRPKDVWLMGGCLPNTKAKVSFRKRHM